MATGEYRTVVSPRKTRTQRFMAWADTVPRLRVLTESVGTINSVLSKKDGSFDGETSVLTGNQVISYLGLNDHTTIGTSFEDSLLKGLPPHVIVQAKDGTSDIYDGFGNGVRSLINRYKVYRDHIPDHVPQKKREDKMKEGRAGKVSNLVNDWAEVATRQMQLGGTPSGMETDLTLALMDANPALFSPLVTRAIHERPLPPAERSVRSRRN